MPVGQKNKVFPLGNLPIELRLMVIEARLIVNNSITPMAHHVYATQRLIPLASVNKEMQIQACKAYYRHNTFTLRTMQKYNIYEDPIQRRFMYPKPQMGTWIQHLILELDVSLNNSSRLDVMLNFPEEWRYLLRPDDKKANLLAIEPQSIDDSDFPSPLDDQAVATRWQGQFPKLKTLKIVLIMKGSSCRTEIPSKYRMGVWRNQAKIHVHARNIEVEIRGCVCEEDFTEQTGYASEGTCTELYQNAVKGMIHAWMA